MDPANLLPANQITSRKRRRDELVGHYDVLGIARTASNLEIRSAYRKGALQTHPDKGGDPEEFKKVVAAFEVLSDPKKRGDYDQVLQQTGSRDGLSANHRYTAEEHAGPSRSKILQGDARVMELDLICTALSEGLNNWASSLEAAGSDILQVLAAQLATKGGKKLPDAGHEDVDGPPRKVEAPEGLPPGWSCFEHTYKSGARKGKKYYSFTSPWGAKRFASVKAALRADAEHHGRDGAEAARLWEASKKPKATASRGETWGTEQRSIYAVRANNGVVRYFVQLSYSSFTIRTGRTLVLAKAIDWHIALTQTVAAASARLREGGSAPLTVAELRQLLQSEPEISLSFRSAFSSKLGTVYSPTSRILEMAVSMQHRFRTFVKRSNLTKENLKAFQVMSLKEVSMQERSRCGLQRQLLRAIHTELRSRGFDLMEIKTMNLPMDSNGSENPMPMHLEVADDEKRTGRTSADEVKSEDVAAAQDLKAALGLSAPSARRLAAFLRTLSTTELRRRVKILQTPSKVELERQAVERTRRSSQSRLALPNPHHQHYKVPALPAPEGELFGLPTDSARAPLKYLNFIDRSKLRAICRAARNLLDFDLANVVVHFTYETEFFDSIPRCTRSGRVMNNGQAVHGRRLLGFLTRHAGLLQQLDLRRAPIDALESNVLRTAFACMNHLTEIHLPTDGWSSHADRQRLLWALPRRVTVQWSKSRELRSPKVQSKFQSKLNQNEKNENNEQTVAVVLPVQPDDSNDPGHAQVLGLSQLIVGWRRIPHKKKKLLYGLLREAAMAGRIESRRSRWEWKLDDPQLQVVKDLLTSVGVSLIRSISL